VRFRRSGSRPRAAARGPRAARPAPAEDDDLGLAVEVSHAAVQLSQRNERRAGQARDLVLVRLAHVQQDEILAPIEERLQPAHVDLLVWAERTPASAVP